MTIDIRELEQSLRGSDLPEPLGGPDLVAIRAAGARRRRARRLAVGSAATATVVFLGALTAGGVALYDTTDDSDGVASPPENLSGDFLAEECRGGEENSPGGNQVMFEGGVPRVMARAAADGRVHAALLSRDGAYWADCYVAKRDPDAEFHASMEVYEAAGRSSGFGYSNKTPCGGEPGMGESDGLDCDRFSVWVVDRVPSQVAEVEFTTIDGNTTRVPTNAGFYAFAAAGERPPSHRYDGSDGLSLVRYLDASGRAVAAQAMDGSGSGRDHQLVDGLPLLSKFPSQRGEPVGW